MSQAPQLTVYRDGVGNVDDGQLNTLFQTCDDVEDLRGFVGTTPMQVYMRGQTSVADGLQGIFYWNATSTAADDDGVTTIKPTGAGNMGCWSRLPNAASEIAPNSILLSQIVAAPANTVVCNPTGVENDLQFQSIAEFLADLPDATTSEPGVIQLATNAQAITGTNTSLGIVPSSLAAALAANVPELVTAALDAGFWQSGQITITGGASALVMHTLGVKPLRVQAVFICTAAVAQYNVGDEIPIDGAQVQVWAQNNTTIVGYSIVSTGPEILNGSGVLFAATSSNFVLVLRAWAV
jgi:hypothetical protein